MIGAFTRAAAQTLDPRFLRVVLTSVMLTALLFIGLAVAAYVVLERMTLFATGWLDTGLDVLGSLSVLALAWLLFPAVVVAVSSLMLDTVIQAVERRHYPGLAPARDATLPEGVLGALKFLGLVAALNILALPLYIAFFFVPPLSLVLYYLLNGYLLGREYYELVSSRRLHPHQVRYLRRQESLKLFLAGIIIAFLSSVPIVNLLAPVIGTAAMVHLFERMRRGLPPLGGA